MSAAMWFGGVSFFTALGGALPFAGVALLCAFWGSKTRYGTQSGLENGIAVAAILFWAAIEGIKSIA